MRALHRVAAAVGLLIAGTVVAGCDPVGTPGNGTTSSASPSSTVTTTSAASTRTPGPVGQTALPDAAMIANLLVDPETSNQVTQGMPYVSPPRPCTGTRPSDVELVRGRAAGGLASPYAASTFPPEGLIEYVAQYTSAEALAAYFSELTADVARCPGRIGSAANQGEWQWSIEERGFVGDESVLIRIRAELHYANTNEPCCFDKYIAVGRQGQVLVATTSLGWENQSGTAAIARKYLQAGLQRAQAALG
jgi:hypothetical protein